MADTDTLSLSLRAWPTKDPKLESLPTLIPRINEQRGAFKNVTEESLEDEIRALEAGVVQSLDREIESEKGAVQVGRTAREDILAARENILKQVA